MHNVWIADTETRGLFGKLFVFGLKAWQEDNYFDSTDIRDFYFRVPNDALIFFHNVDFDAQKIVDALAESNIFVHIDFSESLIVNGRFIRLKFEDWSVTFADSYALLPDSLARLCVAFKVPIDVAKIDLDDYIEAAGYADKDDYFSRVPASDPILRDYLRNDVYAVDFLLSTLFEMSGLDIEVFLSRPTIASLTMARYKTNYSMEYKMIAKHNPSKALEVFCRDAYIGARSEVFRIQSEKAYHYDINGLYNDVLMRNRFPVGRPFHSTDGKDFDGFLSGLYPHAIVKARVTVKSDMFIPVLPLRGATRLLFPTGTFEGSFVGAELQYAMSIGQIEHITVTEGYYWMESYPLFKEWASYIAFMKGHATGAERAFWKSQGNHLYGKFGMTRMRPRYYKDTDANRIALLKKNIDFVTVLLGGKSWLMTVEPVFADYIHPEIAAHVTAYARITLHRFLTMAENLGLLYYCDTDSVVCSEPLPDEFVNPTESGYMKLEGILSSGWFLQPKLYCELRTWHDGETFPVGQEKLIVKGKGMLGDFLESLTPQDFADFHGFYLAGQEKTFPLYDNMPVRRRYLSSLKIGEKPDSPLMQKKSLHQNTAKRQVFWDKNYTAPWEMR